MGGQISINLIVQHFWAWGAASELCRKWALQHKYEAGAVYLSWH
jgi:hypothetical protein